MFNWVSSKLALPESAFWNVKSCNHFSTLKVPGRRVYYATLIDMRSKIRIDSSQTWVAARGTVDVWPCHWVKVVYSRLKTRSDKRQICVLCFNSVYYATMDVCNVLCNEKMLTSVFFSGHSKFKFWDKTRTNQFFESDLAMLPCILYAVDTTVQTWRSNIDIMSS